MIRRLAGPLLAVVVLSASCSSGGDQGLLGYALPGTEVSGAGVSATVPDEWTSRTVPERGLIIARDEADVDAEVPGGPRLIAGAAPAEPPGVDALVEIGTDQGSILSDPESVTVDGRPGVAIESSLETDDVTIVSREVVVKLGDGGAYTLTLEALADQWEGNEPLLQGILDSIRFIDQPTAPPPSPTPSAGVIYTSDPPVAETSLGSEHPATEKAPYFFRYPMSWTTHSAGTGVEVLAPVDVVDEAGGFDWAALGRIDPGQVVGVFLYPLLSPGYNLVSLERDLESDPLYTGPSSRGETTVDGHAALRREGTYGDPSEDGTQLKVLDYLIQVADGSVVWLSFFASEQAYDPALFDRIVSTLSIERALL
jgi:hypothetical protein